jgi:hypothetical protein
MKNSLTFQANSLSASDIVSGFQNRVLSILLAIHEHAMKDVPDSSFYEVKDSYRDYWGITLKKTGNVINFDDGYQEYEFSYELKHFYSGDVGCFVEGKFSYHADCFCTSMLDGIIFDIQEQVSKLVVSAVLDWKKLEYQGTFDSVDKVYTGKIGSIGVLVFIKG